MSVVCEFKTYDDEDGEHLCTRRMGALPRVGDLVSMTGKEVEHPNYPDVPGDI